MLPLPRRDTVSGCNLWRKSHTAAQNRISDSDPSPLVEDDAKAIAHPAHGAWWAEYQKAEDANTEAANAWYAAQDAFLQTQPATLAGLFAFLDHMDACDADMGWPDEWGNQAFPALAAAVRTLIGGAQS
jgi:hypothetical protein